MRAVGIILAGGNSKRMKELSRKRAVCAMPVAGSYRSIDFALSNMEHSRIQKVAVLTQYNSRSLNVVGFRAQAGRIVPLYAFLCGRQQSVVPGNS